MQLVMALLVIVSLTGCAQTTERCAPEDDAPIEGELTFEACTVYALDVPDRAELGCGDDILPGEGVRGGRYLIFGPLGEWDVTLYGVGDHGYRRATFHSFPRNGCSPGCVTVGGPLGDGASLGTRLSTDDGRIYADFEAVPLSIELCPVE